MAEKRIVGIDFGTSTSVVRAKCYDVTGESWRSLDTDVTASRSVTFNNGSVMVPTLVQKLNDSSAAYFGYDAEMSRKGAVVHQNFKVELNGEAPEEAKALTEEFFSYLYRNYREQRDGGYMGDVNAEEKTVISYPVKWDQETRDFMVKAAEKAGFRNVEGMDEAQAAIIAVTALSKDMLEKKNYLSAGEPVNIMLIDMGAGTTDIVICRYTHGEKPQNEILCTWPRSGDILFGGRELDGILKSYVMERVPEEYRAVLSGFVSDMEYKSWKENNVSDSLRKKESITTFNRIDSILYQFYQSGLEEFTLDRKAFEEHTREYLAKFAELVNGSVAQCVKDGTLESGSNIDLVILTGGHSQWYFVKEMLQGAEIGVGPDKAISLGKIKADPNRIIDISKPQETVALGLVYSKLPLEIKRSAETKTAENEESSTQGQTVSYAEAENKVLSQLAENLGVRVCPSCHKLTFAHRENCVFCCLPANGNYEREWNEFQRTLSDFFSNVTSKSPTKNLLKFKKKLDIGEDEPIYYHYDCSLNNKGTMGYAITAYGIKSRVVLELSAGKVTWPEFLTKNFIVTAFIRIENEEIGEPVDQEMYARLQNALRETEYYKLIKANPSKE